jgi:acetylornithine deacetylase
MKTPLPSYQEMLARLVALPSVSASSPKWDQSNKAVIDLLAEWADHLGFKTQILQVAPGKYNLIAVHGEGEQGLVLSGHTDTVPFDEDRWQSDPFKLLQKEHKLYGLGACDMKGFFPAVLETMAAFADQPLREPVILLATADEESSMSGAKSLAQSGALKGRVAVIGEPTNLTPIRMHKGIMMESVRVIGRSGHSSNPALGASALECMQDIMSGLLLFREELQARNKNDAFEISVPTLNLGHIHGGDSPNRICGECELHFDLRPLPGMSIDDLHLQLERWVLPYAQKHETQVTLTELFGGVEAFETPAHADLVATCERLSGKKAEAVAFATEAPYLSAMGMETLVMGPGSIDQAHQPDEFIDLRQIKPTVDMLSQLIRKYCL